MNPSQKRKAQSGDQIETPIFFCFGAYVKKAETLSCDTNKFYLGNKSYDLIKPVSPMQKEIDS